MALAESADRRSVNRWIVALFIAAGLVATMVVTASGQQAGYDQMEMHEAFSNPAVIKRMGMAAKNFSATGRGEETYARVYFSNYLPAKITQLDGLLEINPLVKNATQLLTRAQGARSPGAAKILPWMYVGMRRVVEGNHHPPARINALLVLGRLDESPADRVRGTPPVPYRHVLPILVSQYDNKSNGDGVRAAALTGLHRTVSYTFPTMSAANKTAIKTAMSDLLSSDPPPGRSEKVHAYLQRYAVDILDLLRPQNDSSLGVQLISISTEPSQPDLIALHSAARLGRMSAEMKGKVDDPERVLGSWSARALHAFESELARLNAFQRPSPAARQPIRPEDLLRTKKGPTQASNGGGMSMEAMMEEEDMGMEGSEEMDDGMDMEMNMDMEMDMGMGLGSSPEAKPQPPAVLASRRKLNSVLQQIHLGVTGSPNAGMPRRAGGVLAMVTDEQKATVETWVLAMEPIVVAINESSLDDQEKYVDELTTQIEILREIAGPIAEEAADVPAAPAVAEAAPPAAAAAPVVSAPAAAAAAPL